MNFEFNKVEEVGILTFYDMLYEKHTRDLKTVLMKTMINFDTVVLNFNGVRHMDNQCLHPVCMTLKIAKKLDKHIILVGRHLNALKAGEVQACDTCAAGCPRISQNSCMSGSL
ncbi:MAG: hypothetical protein EPN22_12215 [Nitrospirae bacterium]|nr:MAG: hypothetical protein EPN22_12215 [Nitrospirota bacterium]